MSTPPFDSTPDRRRYILLVEDNPRDAELTLHALEELRRTHEVVHVWDGVDALAFLRRENGFAEGPDLQPALILLDLKMPRLDGLATLRLIKGDPGLRAIPVVIMSSSKEDADVTASYQLGVSAYVVKPMKFRQYLETVQLVAGFWIGLNESQAAARRPGPSA